MKTRLFPFFKSSVRSSSVLAASITMMLGAHSASAATLYWDTDGTTSGFGTASGTWDTDAFWSTDATGASATAATVTTTADFINFGTGTVGLAAGPIAVAGTVSAGSITFGSASGAIALTGGTITLATGAIITVDNASDSISSILAGTNWTKAGTGTLILSGANTHTGNTLSAGTLVMANTQALGTNTTGIAISFTGTTAILDIATDGGDLAYRVSAGSGTISTIASNVKTGSAGINHTLGTLGIGGSATAGLTRLNIVAGGAVLSGTPSITLGNVTLQAGAASVISTFNPTTASLTLASVTSSGGAGKVLNLDGTSTGNFVTGIISISAVTKTNTSTWTLSGANTYTGATTLSAGTLAVSSTGSLANSAITVSNAGSTFKVSPGAGTVALGNTATTASGATLNLANGTVFSMVDGNIGITNLVQGATFATAGLTLSTATLNFELSGATADVLNVTKAASLAGTNTINLTPLAVLTNGTYNLITAASGLGGTFRFANGQTTSVGTFGANNYLLTLSSSATAASVNVSSPGILSWTGQTAGNGAANTSWDTAGSTNWANGTTATAYADGNIVIFNDANGVAGGTTPTGAVVIQAAGVTPGSATFNNSTVNYTVSNASGTTGLAGAGTLTKSGTATLTLSGVNTYTGATSITGGTLKLSGAGTLGVGSSVSVNSGALLDLNGTNQSIKFVAGTGVGTVANNFGSGISTLTLSSSPGGILIQDSTANPGGKVAVVVTVSSQSLNNSNSYSGGTTVNAGAFLYLNGTPLGAGTGAINLTTALTSGLVSDPGVSIANDISGPGYVSINQQANGTLTLTGNLTNTGNYTFRNTPVVQAYNFAGNGTTSTLSGVIGGPGGTNGGNITGSITKSGTGTLSLSGASLYTGGTTLSAGVLNINSAGVAGTNGPLGNGGTFTINGGTIDNTSGTAKVLLNVNPITVGGNFAYSTSGGTSSNNLTLPGSVNLGGATRTITTNGTGTLTLSGVIGTGSLTKDGPGTLTLSGANTYTGNTTVSAGTLSLSSAYLADASTLTIATGAFLNLNYTGTDIVASLSLGGTVKTTGTFDSTNSGGLITGTGKIQVGAATANFSTWATANGINGEPATGDFDKDGLSNLVEYALGLNPTQANGSAGTFTGLILSFTKGSEAFANGDLTYEIESSTTLEIWSVVVANNPAQSTITYTLPTGLPKEFARLKVTQIP